MTGSTGMSDAGPGTHDLRTFVRFRVVGVTGAVDLVAPDDVETDELVRQVTVALQAPPARYLISHPRTGPLTGPVPLRAAGVLEGETLHLVSDPVAAGAAVVDDVAEVVATGTDAQGSWTPAATRVLVGWGAGAMALTVTAAAIAADPSRAWLVSGCLLLALLAASTPIRRPSRSDTRPETHRTYAHLATVPILAGSTGLSAAAAAGRESGLGPILVVLGLLAGCLALHVRAPTTRPLTRVFLVAGMPLLVAAAIRAIGLTIIGSAGTAAMAAGTLAAALAVLTAASRIATLSSGLGALADAGAEGRPVPRNRVHTATGHARTDLTGIHAGIALVTAAVAIDLGRAGGWGVGLGALAAVLLMLRARTVRASVDVLVLVVPGLTALLGLGVRTAVASGDLAIVALAALGIVGVGLASTVLAARPGRVRAGRLRVLIGRVETLGLLAVAPLALAVAGAYSWAWTLVR